MPIQPGRRLGPYEILSAIGAGGMGEVYKARDTRLDRIVAIKVLPSHLADRPELRERFEREAKTIASLNHPHICVLHDIGHQDGTDYLVMEYLEGETLAQRLMKGALPLEQVLQFAIEISDALDKAHRKGVTHRDLKPGNIMLTKTGTKLLDFGLAKLKQDVAPANVQLSQLPTANDPLTAQGAIVGTLQYMAPEQLEGKEVDARTDIFAFGAVVYEMATGKRAFEGKSQASVISAIMSSDPVPMTSLQPMTPPALDRVVKKCLAKDPENRWQTARDLELELTWIAEGGPQVAVQAVSTGATPGLLSRWALVTGLAFFLVVAAITGLAVWNLKPSPALPLQPVTRFVVLPPEKTTFGSMLTGGLVTFLSLSPNGHRLAFVAVNAEGKQLLWVRPLESLEAQPLSETDGATFPFWSPDSRYIAFFSPGKLKKVEVSGGPPQTLCDARTAGGGSWNGDGDIIFAFRSGGPIYRVAASGGVPGRITTLDEKRQETGHAWPFFLPDNRHFLYLALTGSPENRSAKVGSLDSKESVEVLRTSASVAYSPPGYLLFVRESTLMAQPFDPGTLTLHGEPTPVADPVGVANDGGTSFSVSQTGVLANRSPTAGSQLVWFDLAGKQTGVLGDSAAYSDLELSRDGKRASVSIPAQAGNGRDIWLYDVARGLRTRFTFDPADELKSIWSPDGSRIVFNSNRKGHYDLYQKAASGAGAEDVVLEDNLDKTHLSWSPDGRFILYATSVSSPQTGADLFVLPLSGDHKPHSFLQTPFNETTGQFSPDGRWVAYESNESGRNEVYVVPFPGPGGKWQISTGGGTYPRWQRDSTEVFYLAPGNKLMAAAVNGKGSSFEVAAVKPLFQTRVTGSRYEYDVSADGQHFLINTAPEQAASAPITVVVNWTAGLKK